MHSATQGLLVKKIFVQMFYVHTHAYVRTCPCTHTTVVREEKESAILRAEKVLATMRTEPMQLEKYSLVYEGWILKALIHLRMEILASPDMHIKTYMTSFSDRLFAFLFFFLYFFPPQACQVNDSSADSAVSKCSFFLCAMSLENIQCV